VAEIVTMVLRPHDAGADSPGWYRRGVLPEARLVAGRGLFRGLFDDREAARL
jgi:hypothetical protein